MNNRKENNMPDSKLLNFTVRSVTSSLAEIEIKNVSSAPLTDELFIEIHFPVALVDQRLSAAVAKARISTKPRNMASVAGIATVGGGLSVWVFNHSDSNLIALRVLNYLDQGNGNALTSPVAVASGASFVIAVPLTKPVGGLQVTVPYIYRHGGQEGESIPGSIDLNLTDTSGWKPHVSFSIDQPNSTMLKPGSKVKISWSIADGVSATLRGPLPGGHSELTLSKAPESDLRIDKGSLEIYAVGQATYFLDAQVRNPKKENVQVIRTLFLDTKSVDKFASLRVRPNRVLPNGRVDIDWAVWGVEKATLRIGDRKSLTLSLTEQDLSRYYQGTGIWSERAVGKEDVTLSIAGDSDSDFEPKRATIDAAKWINVPTPRYTGKPIGLAVAGPAMALLTSDGLWVATVGSDDTTSSDPKFRKVTQDAKFPWLALGTYEQDFVVLRQKAEGSSELARYDSDGKPRGVPVELRLFQIEPRRPDSVFDVVAFGQRVYVAGEQRLFRGSWREVHSVTFDPEKTVHERVLSWLRGYRLLNFARGLYGLNTKSGHLLRFGPPNHHGEIEDAYTAGKAASSGRSLIRTGLPIATSNLLVVLDPGELRVLRRLPLSQLNNVADFQIENLQGGSSGKEPSEGLVYNPQKDEWIACGQGLDLQPGAVAAFRGGKSERMWVLQPDGKMYTLTEASSRLFASDYVDKFPPRALPPALNATKQLEIRNESGWPFRPLGTLDRQFGLPPFGSPSLAEIDPPDHVLEIRRGPKERFKIRYHDSDPSPVKLRFLVYSTRFSRCFLQVTLSGPKLSNISSVFRYAVTEWGGPLALIDVADTLVQHTDGKPIVIPQPKKLSERSKLVLLNGATYGFARDDRRAPLNSYSEMEINHETEPFSLFASQGDLFHRLGALRFAFNIALPHGIEISAADDVQQSLLRVDTRGSKGLIVQDPKMLKPGDPSLEVKYLFNGEEEKRMVAAPTQGVTYICKIVEKQ
jgi:hypothetical protein